MTTATRSRTAAPAPAPAASAVPRPGQGLVVDRLTLTYPSERGAPVAALDGVSLTARPGELVAVVGPSGCGKTTLLEVVCGLLGPDGGSVGGPPAVLMPQRDLLLPWLDALENAALSLRLAGQRRAEAQLAARELFAELGLDGFERARPQELSGGMRQRVAFARTLLSGKPLLCLDEPFGALDAITRGEMQQWLARSLELEPRTVLLVTHDVEEAIVLCDRVVVLSRRPGRVVAELEVPLGRPRRAGDAEVAALRADALVLLAGTGS
ncbi:MAG TPA: ABC transporter ATP-binding protein [Solirubrobacteraceae bacterium]|nr:ABC transporter ATP-binding protein [Solirubrobacteraceae bacterium]